MPLSTSRKAQITLLSLLSILLLGGFLATSLVSYFASRDSIRHNIVNTELPLTSDNIYSEIQKDLIRPTLIASMMSRDTFLREVFWPVDGRPIALAERFRPQPAFVQKHRNRMLATAG